MNITFWSIEFYGRYGGFGFGLVSLARTAQIVLPRLTIGMVLMSSSVIMIYLRKARSTSNKFLMAQLWLHLFTHCSSLVGLMAGPKGCTIVMAFAIHFLGFVYIIHSAIKQRFHSIGLLENRIKSCQSTTSKNDSNSTVSISMLVAFYFFAWERALYFLTGHKMDFGSLQVSIFFIVVCVYGALLNTENFSCPVNIRYLFYFDVGISCLLDSLEPKTSTFIMLGPA
jgi:hypothetical protein